MDESERVERAIELIQQNALISAAIKKLVAISVEVSAIEEALDEGRGKSAKALWREVRRVRRLIVAADEWEQLLFAATGFQPGASLPQPNAETSPAAARATERAERLKRLAETHKTLTEWAARRAASLAAIATVGLQNQGGRKRGQRSQQQARDEQAREWQCRADEIWAGDMTLSARAVADLLVEKHPTYGYGSNEKPSKANSIRKLIKKPRWRTISK